MTGWPHDRLAILIIWITFYLSALELEYFVYNWRLLLGGAASAGILTVGLAAPALAQSVARADLTPASLSGVTQGLGVASAGNVICGSTNLPATSALTGAIGASCAGSSSSSQQSSSPTLDSATISNPGGPNLAGGTSGQSGSSDASSPLSGLTGAVPGLDDAASVAPAVSLPTSSLPVSSLPVSSLPVGSLTGSSSAASNTVKASSAATKPNSGPGLGGASNDSSQGTLGSVTGTLNNVGATSSLTNGTLPSAGSVTGALSGVSGLASGLGG